MSELEASVAKNIKVAIRQLVEHMNEGQKMGLTTEFKIELNDKGVYETVNAIVSKKVQL